MKSYANTIDQPAAPAAVEQHGLARPSASMTALWKLMVRNVFRQGSRSMLLAALIVFASLVIVFFSQFLEGVSRNFTRNLIDLASGELYVSSHVERAVDRNVLDRNYEYFTLPAKFRTELAALSGYGSVDERLDFDAKVITDRDTLPYQIKAFDPLREPALVRNFTFLEGRMFGAGEYGIIVPVDFARRNGIRVGDRVRVLAKAVSKQVNVIDYVVTGSFRTTNLSAWFDTSAYLDLSAARVLVDNPGALTRLNIHLSDGVPYEQFAVELTHLLRVHRVAGNPELEATHWTEGAAFFVQLTEAMKLGYLIIIAIVTVMIAASLAFTTMMTIVDRTKEIATLGALGATPATIRRLLVGENLVLAAGAAALGTACAGVLFLITSQTGIPIGMEELRGFLGSSHFYPAFQPTGFLSGLIVPVIVAFAASYLFARRASRLPIAEAMADC